MRTSRAQHSSPRRRYRIVLNPSSRKTVAIMVAGLLIAASAAIAQVWTHFQVIHYGYKISKASQQQNKLRQQNRQLRIELALLKSPARVSRIARKQLGLAPPEPDQVRRLRLPKESDSAKMASAKKSIRIRPAWAVSFRNLRGTAMGRKRKTGAASMPAKHRYTANGRSGDGRKNLGPSRLALGNTAGRPIETETGQLPH